MHWNYAFQECPSTVNGDAEYAKSALTGVANSSATIHLALMIDD